jgi:hypothetical protein
MDRRSTFVGASAAAGIFLASGFARAAAADADADAGLRAHQLLGGRYETMLALARGLDERTQAALASADDLRRQGSPVPARLLSEIRSFARSTSDLLRTMGERQVTSVELPSQLADLAQRARRLGRRIRWTDPLASTSGAWDSLADVIERMRLLLTGGDVDVPSAYVQGALSGAGVVELRELASGAEAGAARAHGLATRAAMDYRQRGEQFLGELRHFAGQSRDLRLQANAGKLDPQTVGPLVDHLLNEARQADRRMRQARVFTEVRADSARTISILERMACLVRP